MYENKDENESKEIKTQKQLTQNNVTDESLDEGCYTGWILVCREL